MGHGYHVEVHSVLTEDGYVLGLHRIPYGKNRQKGPRPPILLQHGIMCNSGDWILPGPNQSLGDYKQVNFTVM